GPSWPRSTDTRMDRVMAAGERTIHRKAKDYRWEGVEELPYKEDERALFKSITRQVLFSDPELHSELRYFEMAPGGFSSLERHRHMHAVLILRGRGHCPGRKGSNTGRAPRPRAGAGDALPSIPPPRGRAARLPLHGERHAGQAATALRGRLGEA